MQYLYHPESGADMLILCGDKHRYIFKVRRHRQGKIIALRNLNDQNLYRYEIVSINKKEAHLQLKSAEEKIVQAAKKLHIGWCLIEPKNIEKILPSLNEIGVAKITFIHCNRSQKSFKLDFKRLEKILLNSSQQSGRSAMMKLDQLPSLAQFIKKYPKSYMLNFSNQNLTESLDIETIVVGCEGGFSKDEEALFSLDKIVGFSTPLILKSESAVCAVASKILL